MDAIIHMDSDAIVTGSLVPLWWELEMMTKDQFVGISRVRAVNNNYYPDHDRMYKSRFIVYSTKIITKHQKVYPIAKFKNAFVIDFPHLQPKAASAGLLVMNLTRMREFDWEQKVIQVYNDYSKKTAMNDQWALNILVYNNPGIIYITFSKLRNNDKNMLAIWYVSQIYTGYFRVTFTFSCMIAK